MPQLKRSRPNATNLEHVRPTDYELLDQAKFNLLGLPLLLAWRIICGATQATRMRRPNLAALPSS